MGHRGRGAGGEAVGWQRHEDAPTSPLAALSEGFPSSLLISISAQLLMSPPNSRGGPALRRGSAQLLRGLWPDSLRPGAPLCPRLAGQAGPQQIQAHLPEGSLPVCCHREGVHIFDSLAKNATGRYRNNLGVVGHALFPLPHSWTDGKMMSLI